MRERSFFFLLLCLFYLGVYHRCSDRDMNSQRIAPSEIKTAILSAFPGKFYQDVWGVMFKQFLQAVQMTNHLQWPSKTLCIRPQRTARADQLCKTLSLLIMVKAIHVCIIIYGVILWVFKIGFMRPFDFYNSKIAPILRDLISQRGIGENDGR